MYLSIVHHVPCQLRESLPGYALGQDISAHLLPFAVLEIDLSILNPVGNK